MKVGELHPFVLSICSLLCYEKVKDIVRISVPYIPLLRERGGVFLPTEGYTELSFFLVKLEGPVCIVEMELSSFSLT